MQIDPEHEAEQFDLLGITPARGYYAEIGANGARSACIIGRAAAGLLTFQGVVDHSQEYVDVFHFAEVLGMSEPYALGLMDGWEGGGVYGTSGITKDSAIRMEPEYRLGQQHGAAAWEACVERQLCGDSEPWDE